jgi:dCMP deaminase
MRKIVLLYMPVIHRGYVEFLNRHASADVECVLVGGKALLVLGDIADYVLRKDSAIRGLSEMMVLNFVQSLGLFSSVSYHSGQIDTAPGVIIMPDEDVLALAADVFFPKAETVLDTTRLRYDRKGSDRVDPVPAAVCTSEEAHRALMHSAEVEAQRSKDWWLTVGALVARDGQPLFVAYNQGGIDRDITNILGDPRSAYRRGENTEDTLVLHAERSLIAQAARDGISLHGTDVYVTHFPCVPCASQLAEAGVARVFFSKGYSRLESAECLTARGVEILQVV